LRASDATNLGSFLRFSRSGPRWARAIATPVHSGQPGLERDAGRSVVRKEFPALPAYRPDPSPASDQGMIAEQCWFDGQDVKARHVAAGSIRSSRMFKGARLGLLKRDIANHPAGSDPCPILSMNQSLAIDSGHESKNVCFPSGRTGAGTTFLRMEA